jgi:hypothetical protein
MKGQSTYAKVSIKNLPPKVLAEVRAFYDGFPLPQPRQVEIRQRIAPKVPSNWLDWNVRRIILWDGTNVQVRTDSGYESILNDPYQSFLGTQEGRWPTEDSMIVIANTHPRKVEAYTQPRAAIC